MTGGEPDECGTTGGQQGVSQVGASQSSFCFDQSGTRGSGEVQVLQLGALWSEKVQVQPLEELLSSCDATDCCDWIDCHLVSIIDLRCSRASLMESGTGMAVGTTLQVTLSAASAPSFLSLRRASGLPIGVEWCPSCLSPLNS